MNTNDPWAKMDELIADEIIPDGEGWFTVGDFIERYKVARTTAREKLDSLVRNKTAEKRRGRTKWCSKPQNYFRIL